MDHILRNDLTTETLGKSIKGHKYLSEGVLLQIQIDFVPFDRSSNILIPSYWAFGVVGDGVWMSSSWHGAKAYVQS